ncbi:MAG: glycerol kinase GlpK [Defluviitaleaceae bacterium]|nr:glycerol kinase GlpK [Defluviitaleaceae bacterium]
MKEYILSIDQSTSATKAFLFNRNAEVVSFASAAHRQIFPKEGYVEHDPAEIYEHVVLLINQVVSQAGISAASIAALSISNQRETCVAWDKKTGLPIYNAIVWQCNRAKDICADLADKAEVIKTRTGLVLSPFFPAGKIGWILKNVEGAQNLLKENRLLCGTIDTWLIWKLSGGAHLTDYTNASRTQLFNIHTLGWDDEILDFFDIPPEILPRARFSDEIFASAYINGCEVPIAGVMGDSHAALFAQNCFSPGEAKATYGTGSSVMMNIGETPIQGKNGIVTSVGYGCKKKIQYVFEGNINSTGATLKWLSEKLGIAPVDRFEEMAGAVPSALGVCVVPAFTGFGAPYWDDAARACITGLTFGADKRHIARAGLESVAFQVADILEAMLKDSAFPLAELRVDGGPAVNHFLMQFQADIIPVDIATNRITELSAAGSMLMAGLTMGFWKDLDDLRELRKTGERYTSRMGGEQRDELRAQWRKAVHMARCREEIVI